MIGLDSSAVIDIANGVDSAKEIFSKIKDDFAINSIVSMEFCVGSYKFPELASAFLEKFEETPFETRHVILGLYLRNELRKQGTEIEFADCCIAASYLDAGITTIFTKNTKHFSRIPGLKIISY